MYTENRYTYYKEDTVAFTGFKYIHKFLKFLLRKILCFK